MIHVKRKRRGGQTLLVARLSCGDSLDWDTRLNRFQPDGFETAQPGSANQRAAYVRLADSSPGSDDHQSSHPRMRVHGTFLVEPVSADDSSAVVRGSVKDV
jgi:hypothetical protein